MFVHHVYLCRNRRVYFDCVLPSRYILRWSKFFSRFLHLWRFPRTDLLPFSKWRMKNFYSTVLSIINDFVLFPCSANDVKYIHENKWHRWVNCHYWDDKILFSQSDTLVDIENLTRARVYIFHIKRHECKSLFMIKKTHFSTVSICKQANCGRHVTNVLWLLPQVIAWSQFGIKLDLNLIRSAVLEWQFESISFEVWNYIFRSWTHNAI